MDKEHQELNNEQAIMLLILALLEENKRIKTALYVLYGLLVIGGILWLWK